MEQSIPTLLPGGNLTKRRRGLPALTGLRFFLATWVILHHTRIGHMLYDHGHRFSGNFFLNGYLAVTEFFLLSGFILAYTYRSQIETSRDRVRFWQARFARIWPGYTFSLLFSTVAGHTTPTLGLLVASLFMVQGWNPANIDYAGVWNAVCWTLTVEAFFYLIFPWLQQALEQLRLRHLQLFAIATMLCTVLLNTANKGLGHPGYHGIFHHIPYPIIHLPEFFLGVAAGNLFLERNSEKPFRNLGLLTYPGLFCIVAVLVFPSARWTSTVMIGFYLFTYGLATERTWIARLFSTRTLILGGGISYAMYLLQTPVRDIVNPFFQSGGIRHMLFGKLVLFIAIILVSWIVFSLLEEPARRSLRKWFATFDHKHLEQSKSRS